MRLGISIKTPSTENIYGLLASLQEIGIKIYYVGLPRQKRRWALLRSPHVNSKSRIHYESRLSAYYLKLQVDSKEHYKIFRLLQSFRECFSANMIIKIQIKNSN